MADEESTPQESVSEQKPEEPVTTEEPSADAEAVNEPTGEGAPTSEEGVQEETAAAADNATVDETGQGDEVKEEPTEPVTDGDAGNDAAEAPADAAEEPAVEGEDAADAGEDAAEPKPVEGDEKPTDDETQPVEGDSTAAEGVEGGEAPEDGEGAPTDDAAPDGEAVQGEEDAVTDAEPKPESQEPAGEDEPGETAPDDPGETAPDDQEEKEAEAPVPQSDTFADGEKPESPAPHIGEVLSREGSPSGNADQPVLEEEDRLFSPPIADSPRESHGEEQFDDEALVDEITSPEQDREALAEMYHAAIAERELLQQQNHQLQHKLAEYFKNRKPDEQKAEAVDKNEADQEQRYLKYMSQLEELRAEDQQIRDMYAQEIEELQQRCDEKKEEVDAHRTKFVEFKHQVALNSLNSRSGKPIPPKDIDQYLTAENRKDQEVIAVRLENIKLKNKLKKKEQQLKSKEELADGLHLIDFEQLKIENQTYNEKIEERNEELLKLRKKITNTVQVLTHLKEKLQFVQGENSLLKNKLKDVEGAVAQKRDVLTRTKQARDALRIDNHRLRQNCGLLGNEPLLRDFEERKDEADALKDRLERLKMQHAELTLNTSSVRRKIEQIKANERN